MRELSLFTGAGGGLLGTKLLGFTHIGYVEINEYCQRVIRQRIDDGILDEAPIFGDIRAFINSGCADLYRGVTDVITAGFPCQPFSVAGKGEGENDLRNMWPETIECIRRIRPKYALLENVPGLLDHKYIQRIFGDLAKNGFNAKWTVFGAHQLGGPCKSKRLWIMASTDGKSFKGLNVQKGKHTKHNFWEHNPWPSLSSVEKDWFLAHDYVMRSDNELADRLEQYKCIGNGQIPAMVAKAWEVLNE